MPEWSVGLRVRWEENMSSAHANNHKPEFKQGAVQFYESVAYRAIPCSWQSISAT